MKKRSIAAVVLLPFITLGIYTIYWFVSTKGELNAKGAKIPTAWLLIIPLVSIWWMWKYFEGAEQVTNKKVNSILMFVIALFITSIVSSALCQVAFNNLSDVPTPNEPTAPEVTSVGSEPATPVETVSANPIPHDVSVESQVGEPTSGEVVADDGSIPPQAV